MVSVSWLVGRVRGRIVEYGWIDSRARARAVQPLSRPSPTNRAKNRQGRRAWSCTGAKSPVVGTRRDGIVVFIGVDIRF
jgi:hypothetical protein